jgi:1-pyrroline-5-carboxylate dehydrogenase
MTTTAKTNWPGAFINEPATDFTTPENKRIMLQALTSVRGKLGSEYPLWIAGEKVWLNEKMTSTNPAKPDEIVGRFQKGTVENAALAVEAAHSAFESWRRVPAQKRAEYAFRVAEILRGRKYEMCAWLCYEIGKTCPEADGDVSELIDFCEFYGRDALRLGGPQSLTPVAGEENQLHYIPLGAGVIIPPWNFAAALMGGLTIASIVTGNTVVLKPSGDSPTFAALFIEMLYEAGVPRNVVSFLTGPGSTVGEALVTHPKTRYVAFTGSKEAGLRISEQAAKKQPGQIWIKRTVLEMGGKDAIIVDDEADLDPAVEGVLVSAFGYQGQKCSACSRAIVVRNVYDKFLEKLEQRTKSIRVGPPENLDTFVGPVINEAAMKSILDYIEIGKKEGRLVCGGGRAKDFTKGYFIDPTIIADVSPNARIAREEIFGPVLAVIPADDFQHALKIANDSEFGLTGSVYTRNRAKLEQAAQEFHVGNLYFNRKCTGAQVGGHPFGGFNMSGTDSKAGGRDYLLLFLQAKVVSEKIVNQIH